MNVRILEDDEQYPPGYHQQQQQYQQGMGQGPQDDLFWDHEEEYVNAGSGRFRAVIALAVLAGLVVAGFGVYKATRSWFDAQLDPEGEPGESIQVIVEPNSTTSDIGATLEFYEVIPNSTFFRYYAQLRDEGGFQAGEYTMQVNSSVAEAIAVLNAGPIPPVFSSFGVPEGLWVEEMLPRIADQLPNISTADLQAVLDNEQVLPRYRPDDVRSWEGFLFPAVYEVRDDITPAEVLQKMNDQFIKVTGELGYGAAETKLGISAYEVIIIASMVESEAKTDIDRPRIARVIYNRMRQNDSFDIDAVCMYGSGSRATNLNLEYTKAEMASEEVFGGFTCRDNPSLPPHPISAPGRASLEAALNPSEEENAENWYFYVLIDEEGNHHFSVTYEEHDRHVQIAKDKGLF